MDNLKMPHVIRDIDFDIVGEYKWKMQDIMIFASFLIIPIILIVLFYYFIIKQCSHNCRNNPDCNCHK